jgi:hypothetical protein
MFKDWVLGRFDEMEDSFIAGVRIGMERAAEIADDEDTKDKYRRECSNHDGADAIRKNIK